LRGLVAIAPIAEGEIIVTLPVSAALLVRPKARCPLPEAWCTPGAWAKAPWYVKMGLLILEAAARPPPPASGGGDASTKVDGAAAYVAGLPPVVGGLDTPALGWSPAEVAALACPPLAADIASQAASWGAAFEAYAAAHPASPLLHAHTVPAWAGDGVAPRDRFLWALACVRSRAFSGPYAGPPLRTRATLAAVLTAAGAASIVLGAAPPDRVLTAAITAALFNLLYDVLLSAKVKWHAMAPLVDMANHDTRVASSFEYGYFGDAFELAVTGRAHAPGDQVFISYGPQGGDGLLQYYGFVPPGGNPNDTGRVDVEVVAGGGGKGGGKGPPLRAVFGADGPDPATVEEAVAAGLGGGRPGAAATPALHRALGAAAAGEAARLAAWGDGGPGAAAAAAAGSSPHRAALAAAFREQRAATLRSAAEACERAARRLER